MNRKRLIVILESEIYIYDISSMKLLDTIETGPNPNGELLGRHHLEFNQLSQTAVCALSSDSDRAYLAYPSPAPTSSSSPLSAVPSQPPAPSTGDVLLFDTKDNTALNVIQAHKSPIAALALNSTGTMLATASDKGTVVRVFSVPGAQKLWQFRRGSQSARIFSINFNLASSLLAVSSDSSTIHIYRLAARQAGQGQGQAGEEPPLSPGFNDDAASVTQSEISSASPPLPLNAKSDSSATSTLRKRSYHIGKSFVGGVGGYLPRSVSEMWEPQRDFAFIKLRGNGARTVVAMSAYVSFSSSDGQHEHLADAVQSRTVPQVMVISSEGMFQAYSIDLENGGECSLMKEFS